MLMNRDFFPTGLISYVNIQRQFFDSFVGQTFKVANHRHIFFGLFLAGRGQAGPRLHAGLRLRQLDAEQDELRRAEVLAFRHWDPQVNLDVCIHTYRISASTRSLSWL